MEYCLTGLCPSRTTRNVHPSLIMRYIALRSGGTLTYDGKK